MSKQPQQSLGEQIRTIADQLKQETKIQIKATSHILGAAAQIAENHDQLIDEVTDIMNEDLEKQSSSKTVVYTVENLKKQYKTLRNAKAYFGMKANSWKLLASKLNSQYFSKSIQNDEIESSTLEISTRLINLENEVKNMRLEINNIISLLEQILHNKDKNKEP